MLILIAMMVGCSGPAEPEACPADYSVEEYASDYAEALCYMADVCGVRAVEGMTHEECLLYAESSVFEDVELCESRGAVIVDVCEQWQCSRDIIASVDEDCATANNTCSPSHIFDDDWCAATYD